MLFFAPVGLAMTVVEDLPGLIDKGRQRVELEIGNARVVGRWWSPRARRKWANAWPTLLHQRKRHDRPARTDRRHRRLRPPLHPNPPPTRPTGATVERTFAGYDTLSASQVVRRLESLDADHLRAVQRYEASHRNRRTILSRSSNCSKAIPPPHRPGPTIRPSKGPSGTGAPGRGRLTWTSVPSSWPPPWPASRPMRGGAAPRRAAIRQKRSWSAGRRGVVVALRSMSVSSTRPSSGVAAASTFTRPGASSPSGRVECCYVEAGPRGVGVGTALMEAVVAWCGDRDCQDIDALALPGDRSTKQRLEAAGFTARLLTLNRRLR